MGSLSFTPMNFITLTLKMRMKDLFPKGEFIVESYYRTNSMLHIVELFVVQNGNRVLIAEWVLDSLVVDELDVNNAHLLRIPITDECRTKCMLLYGD